MRKTLVIIGIAIGILLFIAFVFGFVFWFAFGGALFLPNPPKPEITYGEFPISITYELNGDIKVIEDTVICEFDGFKLEGENGKYRKWKAYLKSGNDRITLLRVDDIDFSFEITAFYGLPEYYMGDFRQSREEYERVMTDDRYLGYIQWKNGVQTGHSISKKEVWEMYNLKVIDVKYSLPVSNTFR